MTPAPLVLIFLSVLLVALAAWTLAVRRRQAAAQAAFPEAWRRGLRRYARFHSGLSLEHRRTLEAYIQRFLVAKNFEGCGGLRLTEEMRLAIAAHACRLLLGWPGREAFPGLYSILVYPSLYRVRTREHLGPVVMEGEEERLGESWEQGAIVLAWDEIAEDTRRRGTGRNIILHEFAHQIESRGDRALPPQGRHVLSDAYQALCRKSDEGRDDAVLDLYGAESPAEFFAVATESFFEIPQALRRRHPALYDQLCLFYNQDPA